jgi:alkylation response protein AidB-like acyl-CoA dehydrogenase
VFNPLDHPAVAFTLAYIRTRVEPLRARSDRGASALETAIIAAVLIAAAVLIGGIVYQKVTDAGEIVENEEIPGQ